MNERILLRGVLAFVLLMVGLALLFPHQQEWRDNAKLTFDTTSDSRLYFNNMRSLWYHIEEDEISGMNIYRHRDQDSSLTDGLRCQILLQWRSDEASILFYPAGDSNALEWAFATDLDTLAFRLDTMNRDDHALAGYWYCTRLLNGNDPEILNFNNNPVTYPDREKDNLEETLLDYFRLVNYYR